MDYMLKVYSQQLPLSCHVVYSVFDKHERMLFYLSHRVQRQQTMLRDLHPVNVNQCKPVIYFHLIL